MACENRTSRENAVFCMFAVYEDDCKVDITGASIINLQMINRLLGTLPNADAVAAIPNPRGIY